ncbi:peptidase M48 Ste24p [Gloeothece citriformis PCC 7424]|uniref:Peptidase M48 Ste24p n=1 Tax=Gloeothece citriformis (strain PCC 7424) TaxID=65393 RepID=B7KIW3_GLOC7|nr:M48 family metallopeptidase [Gloeothece citriformis]ACK70799.1 peptidase M48 Ste24p [Gloeothece citriformis PCC 7424]
MKLIWKTSFITLCSLIAGFNLSALAETENSLNSPGFYPQNSLDLALISPNFETNRVITQPILANTPVESQPTPENNHSSQTEETPSQETVDECLQPLDTPPAAIATDQPSLEDNTVKEKRQENTDNSADSLNAEIESETEQQPSKNPEEEQISVSFVPNPTPEEIVLYQQMAQADRYYRCGQSLVAQQMYRELKKPFEAEIKYQRELIPEAIYEPQYLQPGGAVYWRLYQEALDQKHLESKMIAPLKLLTEQHPEFIPGHIEYAKVLREYGKEKEALEALEYGVTLYPNQAPLVMAKIEADQAEKRWLDASLTARRFALFNPDHFRAQEFTQLADENLQRYKNNLRSKLTWNAVGNAVLGGLGYAFMGNILGPLSAIETTAILIQGEEAIGESSAKYFQKRLKLVEDEEVVSYVREMGEKIAGVAGRSEFDYEFFVIMDENLNAFALPGGKIFINAGAILKTNSEAELAGLIAHELSHTVLSHSFQLMTSGNLLANVTQFVPYLGSSAGDLIVLNYSRDMEREADIFGTRLLAASGYAADGVRNLMIILEKEDNASPPAWLSTHPDTSDRVKYVEKMIVQERLNRYTYEGVERHWKIRNRVGQLLDEYRKEKEEKEENKGKDPDPNQEPETNTPLNQELF